MKAIEQRVESIRADREHGSRWLVREAVSLIQDMATAPTSSPDVSLRQIQSVAWELAHARPAMAALAGAMGRLLADSEKLADIALKASQLLQDYEHATEKIVSFAHPLLAGTLMTHSLSGTVRDVLVACRTRIERVIVLEGRPRYEGRDMARVLAQEGIAVTLITDAQADIFLSQVSAVVVGADAILANGDVFNKAGTALLAWAAHGQHKPFYVLCETLKIAPHTWTGDIAQLEEKEPEEVLETPIEGVTVRNFYFDRTPTNLITQIITEQGLMSRQDIQEATQVLREILARQPQNFT